MSYAGLGLNIQTPVANQALRQQAFSQLIRPVPGSPPPVLDQSAAPVDQSVEAPMVDPALLLQPQPQATEIPWMWIGIGAGALVAAGGAWWYWRSRKKVSANRRRSRRRGR